MSGPRHLLRLFSLLYIGTIFLFAFLYHFLVPREFHQSNIRSEPWAAGIQLQLCHDLEQRILYNMARRHERHVHSWGSPYFSSGEWEVGRFWIRNIEADASTISFDILIGLGHVDAGTSVAHSASVEPRVVVTFPPEADPVWDSTLVVTVLPGFSGTYLHEDSNYDRLWWLVFPDVGIAARNLGSQGLKISAPLLQEMERFQRAMTGSPNDMPFGFWRMVYFSSVTITTVGYGDITPTGMVARMLTAIEAVVGIGLIGWFVNAAFSRKTDPRNAP